MISRAESVNLSNMPVVQETAYRAGAPGSDPSLDKLLSSLSVEDTDPAETWKVTKFEMTPPVCARFSATIFSPLFMLVRCRHTLSRMLMATLHTWKTPTRVLLAERRDLYGSTVVFCLARNCNILINSCGSATPNHIHQGQFALDVTAKVLPIYESLFDIEYPLPKLDTLGKDLWLKVIFMSLTAGSCGGLCNRRHGENSFRVNFRSTALI
jgi:aminopeptidase 2